MVQKEKQALCKTGAAVRKPAEKLIPLCPPQACMSADMLRRKCFVTREGDSPVEDHSVSRIQWNIRHVFGSKNPRVTVL